MANLFSAVNQAAGIFPQQETLFHEITANGRKLFLVFRKTAISFFDGSARIARCLTLVNRFCKRNVGSRKTVERSVCAGLGAPEVPAGVGCQGDSHLRRK